jgi:hypothetical protein
VAPRNPLKVVPVGAKVPRSRGRRQTVKQAAESGSRRDLLVAMRGRVATQIDDPNCPPRDLAALTRRMSEFAKEIEALDAADREEAEENAGPAPDEAFDASAI